MDLIIQIRLILFYHSWAPEWSLNKKKDKYACSQIHEHELNFETIKLLIRKKSANSLGESRYFETSDWSMF